MSTHNVYTSSAPTQNLQLGEGFIYGKFIEIELNGSYDPFSLTKLDGASFYVSKTPQAGGPGAGVQINVAEAWVNGESLLLVLDSADSVFPSLWQQITNESNFSVSLPSSNYFSDGTASYSIAATTPSVSLDEVRSFTTVTSPSFSQGMPFSDNPSLLTSSIDDDAVLDALFANPNIGGSDLYLTMGTTTTLQFVELAQDETTGRDSFSLSGNDLTPSFEDFVIANNENATHVLVVREQDISFPTTVSGNDTLATALTDAKYAPTGAEPTVAELATTLKGWDGTWTTGLTFGVTADGDSYGDTVTFTTGTTGVVHGLQTRDALIVLDSSWDVPSSIGGIANNEVRAIKQAFSGVHEVTRVSDTSFTIEVDHDFSSNIAFGTSFSSLNFTDVKAGLNLDRLQENLAWDLIDEINSINLSATSPTGGVSESLKAYTEGGTSTIPLPNLYEFNVSFASLSKANVYASGSTTETQEIVFSDFGLDRIFPGVVGLAMAGESGLSGSLLAPTSITGAGADDRIFAGGAYMAGGGYFPQSVSGGGGNDTLVLLGQASDYAVVGDLFGGASVQIHEDGVTMDSSAGTVMLKLTNNITNLDAGDWVLWSPTGMIGGVNFTSDPFPAASVLDITAVGTSDGLQTFTFDVSRFNFTSNQGAIYEAFSSLEFLDSIPIASITSASNFDVIGLASNSYSGTSALLSTVIASTRLDVTGVEKIEFAQWPLDAPLPAYDLLDLGYLPLEPIHITTFNATQTNLSSAFDISTRLLDLSALTGTNIEVDATIDLDGLGTGYVYYETGAGANIQRHEVEIGDFSGYIISGSNTAVFGRDDYSELVVVKGAGENLFIELNNSPDLFGLDVLAFTNQTHGITINLSQKDAETGAVTFTNGLAAGVTGAVSGSVFGARGVIGSNQNDVITGSNQASLLSGGGGNDTVTGGADDDFIMVGGNSLAVGGAGEDTLVSWGSSTLTGGAGNDVFLVSGDSFTKNATTGVFTASTTNRTNITDFDFAEDGASRPGRSSSWDERVGITLSLSALVGLGVLPNTTAEGESLSPADWSALRSKLDFEVTEVKIAGNDAIRVDVTYDYKVTPTSGPQTDHTITLASFTADRALVPGETINATMIADEYRDLDGSVFGVPGLFDMFDLVTTYKGLDSTVLTTDIDTGAPGITAGGPDSPFAIADDRVVIYIGMEKNDVSVIRSDFPPTTPPGQTIALFARKGDSGDLESNFEGSNANERFVGGKAADEYRFIAETFYVDEKTVSNEQSFGRDLIIERGSFAPADTNRDAIVVKDLQINKAVFNRTEISREGAGQSLEISWDGVTAQGQTGLNAGDVSVLRQYAWTTQRFRVEDIILSDGGVGKTYDLGVTKARGAELHASGAKHAILVGRDEEADTFVVNAAGAAAGPQNFDLHLWGLDESDTLRFEGMGALKSFVAEGSVKNGDYIEHSAVLTFEGGSNADGEDDWRVNTTFHQDATRDFDFMKLVVDPDGKVDGPVSGGVTNPSDLDANNLILFDHDGPEDGLIQLDPDLYEFDLDRQEAIQEARLKFDGETVDIYLLDDDRAGAITDVTVTLSGFMEDTSASPHYKFDSNLGIVFDDRDGTVGYAGTQHAQADEFIAKVGSISTSTSLGNTSKIDTTLAIDKNDPPVAAGASPTTDERGEIAILNFVDEDLDYVFFSDSSTKLAELELSTIAPAS